MKRKMNILDKDSIILHAQEPIDICIYQYNKHHAQTELPEKLNENAFRWLNIVLLEG